VPKDERFYGLFFHDWESGVAALRHAAQDRLPVSMLRLSDAVETETTLLLSGKDTLVTLAGKGLDLAGYGSGRCLLIFGVTAESRRVGPLRGRANALFRRYGGTPAIRMIGESWQASRFRSPYLRNTLWEHGYAIDTLETAIPWAHVLTLGERIIRAMEEAMAELGERVLAFAHLSHIYPDGASVYITFLFRRGSAPEETLRLWQWLKRGASQSILESGGTISHQHGVGADHAHYLPQEKGRLGIRMLQSLQRELDPEGMLNPGKLLAD
jgi:alkyldihydroxyacetonephosphate synthase